MTSIAFEERTGAFNPVNGINPGNATAPTLADLDGDGDLDLVVGEQGGRVRYYLNTGNAWAPRFSQQSGNSNPFGRIDLRGDATTTPALADMDADGDLDLVMGDAGGDLNYYENIGAAVAPTFAKRSGTSNPFNGLDVNGGAGLGYSAPAVADLDGDGDLDLAVGAKDGSIRYYENSGSATAPAFSGNPATGASGAANPFAGISVSGDAAPAFWDLDRDGDLDLVVGQNQNPGVDRHHGGFRYFENTGNALAPAFTERTIAANPFDGFSGGSFDDAFTKPTLADLDGDGAPDLVFGNRGNNLEYREGVRDVETERPSSPLRYREAAVNLFRGIDVGDDSMPAFADLDRDGDLDLVVGGRTDGLHYFENVGGALAPLFEERVGVTDNPFDGVVLYGGKGAPTFADLDADGDLDLAVGNRSGTISYYRNIGNARSPRYQEEISYEEDPFGGLYVHGHAAPAFADLDGDGDLDMLVGSGNRNFNYYENTGDAAAAVFERRHPGEGAHFEYEYFVAGRSAPTLADLDGDGDLDLLIGNGYGNFYYYENGGNAAAPAFPWSPHALRGIDAGDYAAPVLADLDGDGLLELVSGHSEGGLAYYRPVVARTIHTRDAAGRVVRIDYDEDGDGAVDRAVFDGDGDGDPERLEVYLRDDNAARADKVEFDLPLSYARTTAHPFRGIDAGNKSAPVLADLDGDGDSDMVIGESGGAVYYYRNNNGVFDEQLGENNPFDGLRANGGSRPALADLDGDGDLDLVVGKRNGWFNYYENTGNAAAPAFEQRHYGANHLRGIDAGENAAPVFADLDGDGDLDLVVGKGNGFFNYYENTGGAAAPAFEQQHREANPLHGIDVGENAVPALADLDGDGDLDLLAGKENGWFNYYENIGNARAPAFQRRSGVGEHPLHGNDAGGNAAPAFADLDGDRVPELVVGNREGTLKYYHVVSRSRETYTLDEDGDVIRTAFDDDADGAADRVEDYARDSAGRVTATGFDDDADGAVDRREFDADADGAPERTEYDTDDDGDIDRVEFDANEDGAADRTETHARNDAGFIIRTEHDDNADGAVDRVAAYVRDAAGRVTAVAVDVDYDGVVDRTEYDADADGDIDRIEFNTDDAGSAEYAESYARDDAGGIIRIDFDYGLDGVIDRARLDTDGDGAMDRLRVYALDAANRRTGFAAFDLPLVYQAVPNSPLDGVVVGVSSARAFADLDGDGDLDLAVGGAAGSIFYYRNTGDSDSPTFVAAANPFHGIDVGGFAAPAFADLDGDGDLDLVIGEKDGVVNYFENTGSATAPGFEERTGDDNPVHGVTGDGLFSMPRFADLDGDGDLDLVMGGQDSIRYYENTGGAAAEFVRRQGEGNNPFHHIRGGWTAPALADLDGDGDLDLLVDTRQALLYYENTGSAAAPRFEARVWTRMPPTEPGQNLTPAFADLDGDQSLELFLGGRSAYLRHYRLPVIYRETYQLNPAGAVIRTDFDAGGDGVIERSAFDEAGDGSLDRSESYVYDAAGRLSAKHIDDAVGGAFDGDFERSESYAYDSAGKLLKTQFDDDFDGATDRSESYAYDAAGAAVIRIAFDAGNDGVSERYKLDTDANGAFDRTEYDNDGDGVAERVEIDANENGAVERTEFDSDENGVVERVVFDVNENGAVDRIEFDNNEDGAPDRVVFYAEEAGTVERSERRTYDGDGRLGAAQIDDGDNGAFDRSESYAYDGDGRLSETQFDDDYDGVFDRSESYAYDGDGRLDKTQFDDNYDGVFDRSESYAYGGGRLDKTRFDDNYDGVFDRSESYMRDDAGAVMRVEIERDKDDFVDEYRYDYDADGTFDWISYDRNDDGMMDRFEFHWEQDGGGEPLPMMYALTLDEDANRHTVSFHDGTGEAASGWSDLVVGSVMDVFSFAPGRDVVSELKSAPSVVAGAALPVDAGLLAGVPAIQLAGAGAGSTDLGISSTALSMLAGGDENYRLRIDGDGDDVLRFDMDDFTEGESINLDGESYRQFVGEEGGFLVDPDVVLVDV